ncbi:MAG: RNA polymerase factor sigma-54 [Roseiflexaceae bacterium]
MLFDLSMTPEMGMRATPALLNLAHLLALPTLELSQAIQQELAENPALEEAETQEESCPRCGGPLLDQICLRCAHDTTGEGDLSREPDEFDPLLVVAAPRNISEILLADLRASLPESEHPIALALIGSIDERGFLADDPNELADRLGVAYKRIELVLQRLRELGPPGIATRNTRECLLAQIDALATQGVSCPHAREVVDQYLEDLAARRLRPIAKELHISQDAVEQVRLFVRRHLWPYPLQAASDTPAAPQRTRYRTADLVIVERDGQFVVEILSSSRRVLRLNPLYQDLARQAASLPEEERAHVQAFVGRARVFLANLRQREQTLQRIGEAIVEHQQAFLQHGVRHLTPLTRAEIALEIGVHESTVSRATANKTALLPNRTLLPLSEFFVAARGVQDVLRELIEQEQTPLSDEELAQMLKERGYSIARRTVAKYRDLLRIPPSHLR